METVTEVSLSHDENLHISISEISGVIQHLEALNFNERNIVLINLFKESLREITGLYEQRSDITQVSIQVRNIFELYLTAMDVYNDSKRLKSWLGQMHKDLEEVNIGFIALLKKNGIEASQVEELVELCNKHLKESPYKSKGSFNLKDIAVKYEYEEHYNFLYKLSSKLIHPSSMKVNGYSDITENDNYITVLAYCGVSFSKKMEEFAKRVKNEIHA